MDGQKKPWESRKIVSFIFTETGFYYIRGWGALQTPGALRNLGKEGGRVPIWKCAYLEGLGLVVREAM